MLPVSCLGSQEADDNVWIPTYNQWNGRKNRSCCNRCETVGGENEQF